MSNLDYIIMIIASSVSSFIELNSYNKLSRNIKLKLSFKMTLFIIITGLLLTINIYTNTGYSRPFISFTLMVILAYLVFKDEMSKTIFYTLICYLIMFVFEILLSSIILYYFKDLSTFDENIVLKISFSLISDSLTFLICSIGVIRRLSNKIIDKFNNKYMTILIFGLSLIILFIIDVKYSIDLSNKTYLINLFIFIGVFSLMIINIYNYFKIHKEIEKTEILLNFMDKYESIIDNDRVNRHEMLNNLLVLKSIKNKNTKEYDELLNDLISSYSKKGIDFKNINKLPSGLKGIFYFKLNNLEEKGFKVRVNANKQVSNKIKKLPHKEYVTLYKIVGILLDNAVEAAEKSNNKIINIDIYNEKDSVIIMIDNSFKGRINLKNMNDKYYSTKGKKRGLGLYIVNGLLRNSSYLVLEQSINKKIFTSKITINKK